MRVLLFSACLLLGALAASDEFESFKAKFNKVYATPQEEALRKQYFYENLARIEKLNQINGEPVFGITFHTDREPGTHAYARGRKGHGRVSMAHTVPVQSPDLPSIPKSVDWRKTNNVITPVKNQGQCGSCWAFSVAEQVESQFVLAGGNPVEFSPQHVASCVQNVDECCDGCGGGDTVVAYNYFMQSSVLGVAPSAFWPYVQGLTPAEECTDLSCTASCTAHNLSDLTTYSFYIGPYAAITGYTYATDYCTGACANQNLTKLAASLSTAPVSICVNAGTWDDYAGGVLTSKACGSYDFDDLDHCVQLVGYDDSGSSPYWIVRNSWSSGWGEDGYIRLQFDENTCGLADEATQVQLSIKS